VLESSSKFGAFKGASLNEMSPVGLSGFAQSLGANTAVPSITVPPINIKLRRSMSI
jgi:hypothetical protein